MANVTFKRGALSNLSPSVADADALIAVNKVNGNSDADFSRLYIGDDLIGCGHVFTTRLPGLVPASNPSGTILTPEELANMYLRGDGVWGSLKYVMMDYLPLAGGTMTGNISMSSSKKITDMAEPTSSSDAATKNYVDNSTTNADGHAETLFMMVNGGDPVVILDTTSAAMLPAVARQGYIVADESYTEGGYWDDDSTKYHTLYNLQSVSPLCTRLKVKAQDGTGMFAQVAFLSADDSYSGVTYGQAPSTVAPYKMLLEDAIVDLYVQAGETLTIDVPRTANYLYVYLGPSVGSGTKVGYQNTPDWIKLDYIHGDVGSGQSAQSDWEQDNSSAADYIKHRPAVRAGIGMGAVTEGCLVDDTIAWYGRNYSIGTFSHAEGQGTLAWGPFSHAEGANGKIHGGTLSYDQQTPLTYWVYDGTGTPNTENLKVGAPVFLEDGSYATITGKTIETITVNTDLGQLMSEDFYYFLRPSAFGNSSHAEGYGSSALASYAHAEGEFTQAAKEASHAEGESTLACGNSSHSEGIFTISIGTGSHAEGGTTNMYDPWHYGGYEICATVVSGSPTQYTTDYPHGLNVGDILSDTKPGFLNTTLFAYVTSVDSTTSFTLNTTIGNLDAAPFYRMNSGAHGDLSHTEGYNCSAIGNHSHAEGQSTLAIGADSHTEGTSTQATNACEHAQGVYNKSNTGASDSQKTLHSIGIGNETGGTVTRKNAVEVMANGDVFIYGIGNYDGTNPSTARTLKEMIDEILGQL